MTVGIASEVLDECDGLEYGDREVQWNFGEFESLARFGSTSGSGGGRWRR